MLNQGAIYADITKVDELDDGTINVYGVMASDKLDADGQRTDMQWLRSQIPDFMKWANIREMHRPSAVGTASMVEDEGDHFNLTAHVVDAEAVKKVQSGVYKGFSIGVKGLPGNPYQVRKAMTGEPPAPKGVICGGALIEVSLVDRPAIPDSAFSVVKNTELLDTVASDTDKLTQAAALIREVMGKATAPVQPEEGADKAPISISASINMNTGVYGEMSYEAAIAEILDSLGLRHEADEASTGEVDKMTDVDKTMIADAIKSLSADERKEVGLITQEDLDALKSTMVAGVTPEQFEGLQTSLTALDTKVTEMGGKILPTAVKVDGAIPTIVQSQQTDELRSEAADLTKMIESGSASTRQFAQARLDEVNRAIAASSTPEA